MPRRWRGPLVLENMQTGDGRVIAEGAITWVVPPLPLGWIVGGDQHIDLVTDAPVIGHIDTITREPDGTIMGGGIFVDEDPNAAEVIRRLEAGQGPLGARWGISIDPDDWALEIVDTSGEDAAVVIMASSRPGDPLPTRETVTGALRAAAGEPDPEGEVLFEDSADWITLRFTRLRIRGATLCAVAAFDGAWIELDGEGEAIVAAVAPEDHEFVDEDGDGRCDACMAEDDEGNCTETCGMTEEEHQTDDDDGDASAVTAASAPVAPPVDWFRATEPALGSDLWVEQSDGGLGIPLTIDDDGRVFGHLARWGQCHTGYQRCVSPPPSMRAYADFMVGEVRCAGGERVATGVLTVGTDHAAANLLAPDARDHYANTGLGWADVVISSGEVGPWVAGAVRPEVLADPELLRVLRATVLSGDWRPIGGSLELIAALSVNSPGFPIQRVPMALAASASVTEIGDVSPMLAIDAEGNPTALVAAGVVHRCSDCAARARHESDLHDLRLAREGFEYAVARMNETLSVIERRTRHLVPEAIAAAAARVRR